MSVAVSYKFDCIPDAFRSREQWICWRSENRDGDTTKVPRQPNGSHASSTDPATWTDFETARGAYESGDFDGIGFVFSEDDPFVGVDLDDCVQDGSLTRGALDVIERLDSYTEGSPSGTGVHVICKGYIPHERNRSGDVEGMKELEIYEDGRYFTMTGQHLDGTPDTPKQVGKELYALCKEVFGTAAKNQGETAAGTPNVLEDRELVEKAKRGKNGAKFRRLWNGDTGEYQSHSEADLALCNILAFYTGGDRAQINRLFQQSGLYREKWDRDDYRQRTINKALEGRTEFYEPSEPSDMGPRGDGQPKGEPELDTPTGWDKVRALYSQGDKSEARLEAAKQAIDDHAFATHSQSERLHVYDSDSKVYEANGDQALAELLVRKLGTHHSRHEQDEIQAKIEALTYQDSFGGPFIPVANGDLQISPLELKDATPKRAPLARSAAAWDDDADCPLFRNHLETVIPDKRERETLQEYVGYSLLHWRLPFHKALFLVGPTASGKSTTLDVVRALMGKVSNLSPQQLVNGRFGPSELEGAWANIRADISAALLKDVGLFKEIVAGDPIYVERKYEQGYTLHPTAKHLYSANRLPDVKIDDDAFYRRILLVSFPRTIPREDRIPDLGNRLQDELDGVLSWAVNGLRRIVENKGFTHDLAPQDSRRKWEEHSSSIGRFKALALNVTGNPEHVEAKQDVFSTYAQFCEDRGLSAESQRKLTSTLKGDPRITDGKRTPQPHGDQVRCYIGVQLPEEDKVPF